MASSSVVARPRLTRVTVTSRMPRSSTSAILPAGGPLFEERADPFLRIAGERVERHHFFGVCVGFVLAELDLRVEGLFTGGHSKAAGRSDAIGERARLLF